VIAPNNMTLRNAYDWLGHSSAVTMIGNAGTLITGICTDSRQIKKGDLFFAIVGDTFDAHDFVLTVQQYAAAVVIDRVVPGLKIPALLVANTREALGEIALGYRQQFDLPLVAVAGSNGKTTVKEMIAAIFAQSIGANNRLCTVGNLNNDLGVPFTLLRLSDQHRLGVIEMGMNHPGEIKWVASITRAQVALVNNAQREHQEFMSSVEATAFENGAVIEALPQNGTAIFPFDDNCSNIWRTLAAGRATIEFGLGAPVIQVPFVSYVYAELGGRPESFELKYKKAGQTEVIPIGISVAIDGEHNVRNALAAASCSLAVGIDLKTIAQGLGNFAPAKGRLVRHRLPSGALLIDDSYNANPDSVRAAIRILADVPSPRILVLGDMGEVGSEGVKFHQEVGEFAKEQAIDYLLLLGDATQDTGRVAGAIAEHCGSIERLITRMREMLEAHPCATVLVKGSRFMKMERVVLALTEVGHAA
jgi:UDP-N-acetylmuramoyl-tripeptide--D-alanyl-D-alanine ligase